MGESCEVRSSGQTRAAAPMSTAAVVIFTRTKLSKLQYGWKVGSGETSLAGELLVLMVDGLGEPFPLGVW